MTEVKMKIPALVLAGGNTPESLMGMTQETERSFIPLMGKPLIEHTVGNIDKNMFLNSITLIGNVERLKELFPDKPYKYLEDQGTLLANLMMGLKSLEEHRRVLILTSDIPLITADIISSTLIECQKDDAECYYPIVLKSMIEKKFPGGKRTYVSLREGQFSGGNVFLVNPKALIRNEHIFKRLIRDRKNVMKLAGFFGFTFILKMVFGILDIATLENKASKLLGVSVKTVVSPHAELAVDVDKEKDLLDVTRFLERKQETDNRVNSRIT